MMVDFMNLKGYGSVKKYEAEFSRLMRFTLEGFHDNERTKVQKFLNRLELELGHELRGFELATLSTVVNKAMLLEQSRNELRAHKAKRALITNKRPMSPFRPR